MLATLLNQELIQSLLIIPVGIMLCFVILITILIVLQPENTEITTYKLPFSPFLQLFAIFANMFLLAQLDLQTYVRLAIWLVIGMVIYFCYGMRMSVEHTKIDGQLRFFPCIELKPKIQKSKINNESITVEDI